MGAAPTVAGLRRREFMDGVGMGSVRDLVATSLAASSLGDFDRRVAEAAFVGEGELDAVLRGTPATRPGAARPGRRRRRQVRSG